MTPTEAIYDMEKEKLHTYTVEYRNVYGQKITPTAVEMQNGDARKIVIYPSSKTMCIFIFTRRGSDEE